MLHRWMHNHTPPNVNWVNPIASSKLLLIRLSSLLYITMKNEPLLAMLLALSACSTAHNPFIIKNTTSASLQSATRYQAHGRGVFVTGQPLPPGTQYEVLERIEIGRIWYGPSKD